MTRIILLSASVYAMQRVLLTVGHLVTSIITHTQTVKHHYSCICKVAIRSQDQEIPASMDNLTQHSSAKTFKLEVKWLFLKYNAKYTGSIF